MPNVPSFIQSTSAQLAYATQRSRRNGFKKRVHVSWLSCRRTER